MSGVLLRMFERLRRVVRAGAWAALFLVGLAGILLVALQVDAVGGAVLRAGLTVLSPEGVDVEVGRVSGSWVRGLELSAIRVEDRARASRITIDSLALTYRIASWRPGRVTLDSAEVVGASVALDDLGLLQAAGEYNPDTASEVEADDPSQGWTLRVGTLRLRAGALRARSGADEPFLVDSASARLDSLVLGPGRATASWLVDATFSPAGHPASWGRMEARGLLTPTEVRVDTLTVRSPESRVAGWARVSRRVALSRPGGLTWSLEATPLGLADLQGLVTVPGVLAGDSITLRSTAWDRGDSAAIHVEARSSAGAAADATLSWGREDDAWRGRAEARVEGLRPARYLGETAPAGPVEAWAEGDGILRFAEGAVERGSLQARWHVSGPEISVAGRATALRERDPGGHRDSLHVELEPSRWDRVALSRGLASTRLSEGRLVWNARLEAAEGGLVAGRGTVSGIGGPEPIRHEASLTLRDLLEPYSGSRLDGTVGVGGIGDPTEDGSAEARVRLGSSRLGRMSLDTAEAVVTWQEGVTTSRGSLSGDAGAVDWEAEIQVSPSTGELRLSTLHFDDLRLAPDSAPWVPDRLSGSLDGRASWSGPLLRAWDPEAWTAALRFRTGSLALSTVAAGSLDGEVRYDSGRVESATRILLADSASVDLFVDGTVLDTVALTIRRGRFQGLSPAAFGSDGPGAALGGTLVGDYRRLPGGGAGEGSLDVALEPSRLAGDTVRGGTVAIALSPQRVHGAFRGEMAGGYLTASFARALKPVSAEPRLRVDVAADLPDAGALLGTQSGEHAGVSGRASLEEGADGARSVRVDVAQAAGWGVTVDTLVVRATTRSRLLVVDTLYLASTALEARGSGSVPLALLGSLDAGEVPSGASPGVGSFLLDAVLPDSGVVVVPSSGDRWVGRGGSLRLSGECQERDCVLDGSGEIDGLLRGRWGVGPSTVTLGGTLSTDPERTELNAALALGDLRVGSAVIRRLDAVASYDGADYRVSLDAAADRDRTASATVQVAPRPGETRVILDSAAFRGTQEHWSLTESTSLRLGPGGVELGLLDLSSAQGRVRIQGVWGDAERDLVMDIDSLAVGPIADLFGAPELGGVMGARIELVDGVGDRGLVFEGSLAASLTRAGRPLHTVSMEARSDQGALRVDGSVSERTGPPRVTLAGSVPVPGSEGGAWALDLTGDSVPLGWLDAYLPESAVRRASGAMKARLSVRGPKEAPLLAGPLEVRDAAFELPWAGLAITGVHLVASGDGRQLRVDTLTARSGGRGHGFAHGTVALQGPGEPVALDLALETQDFLATNTHWLRTVVTGQGTLSGTSRFPRLTAQADVVEGELWLDDTAGNGLDDVVLSDEDWAVLEERFGVPGPSEQDPSALLPRGLAMDLDLSLERDTWLRQELNPRMAIQFTGDVRVTREEGERLIMNGRLEGIPGRSYFGQFSTRFALEEGTIQLVGPLEDTRLDFTSSHRVPSRGGYAEDVIIRMGVAGQVGDLELTLSSEPAMDPTDIVSYLATGRTASEAFSGGGGVEAAAEMGMGLVAHELSSVVRRYARNGVGLDVVEIRQEGLQGASLVAGKYVTPRLFIGFRQPVSFSREEGGPGVTEADVEWRAVDWLIANLQAGGAGYRLILEGSRGY